MATRLQERNRRLHKTDHPRRERTVAAGRKRVRRTERGSHQMLRRPGSAGRGTMLRVQTDCQAETCRVHCHRVRHGRYGGRLQNRLFGPRQRLTTDRDGKAVPLHKADETAFFFFSTYTREFSRAGTSQGRLSGREACFPLPRRFPRSVFRIRRK